MTTLVFDIETNGLLPTCTKIHCITSIDLHTSKISSFDNKHIQQGIEHISKADLLIGHNISGFDIQALEKLSEGFSFTTKMHDTLLMSRMHYISTLRELDFKRLKAGFPKKLVNSHSLEAWGYRLHQHKGTFSQTTDWKHYSPQMLDYCQRDTYVTLQLYKHLLKEMHAVPTEAWETEALVNYMLANAEQHGIGFDEVAAAQLYGELMQEREQADQDLQEIFKPKTVSTGLFTPKRDNARLGYKAGCQIEKLKIVDFNPGSTAQIADRLTTMYAWKPTEFTETGQPKVTESVLETLTYPPIPLLIKYKTSQKLIAQIAEGNQNWLKLSRNGKLHGTTYPTGARTTRMAHAKPNLAQIPSREDVRSLFQPTDPSWLLLDTDLSGIELRILAHYLAKFDDGTFSEVVSQGDPHKLFMTWTGIKDRSIQKSFSYGLIYGAGYGKLGSIIYKDLLQRENVFKNEKQIYDLGRDATDVVLTKLTGYRELIQACSNAATKRGQLKLLDGRYAKTATEHSALNTLIQGSASVLMKHWMSFAYKEIQNAIDPNKVHLLAAIHDELLYEVADDQTAQILQLTLELAVKSAEKHLQIKCPLSCESQTGNNWSEVH